MVLELSKMVAAEFLDHAKRERPRANASYNRSLSQAKDYYRNYLREITKAAKDRQEVLEWDRIIDDLKNYEPDRELPSSVEEIITELRAQVSKGRDEPEVDNE